MILFLPLRSPAPLSALLFCSHNRVQLPLNALRLRQWMSPVLSTRSLWLSRSAADRPLCFFFCSRLHWLGYIGSVLFGAPPAPTALALNCPGAHALRRLVAWSVTAGLTVSGHRALALSTRRLAATSRRSLMISRSGLRSLWRLAALELFIGF